MKDLTKGQPVEMPIPARTGHACCCRTNSPTPEKALEFLKENKERAKPAK